MKYLYADSAEFPLQRNFLGLLEDFIKISVSTITLENEVFDMKQDIMDRRRLKRSVITEMDGFLSKVRTAISEAVASSEEKETINEYAEKSNAFLRKFVHDGKAEFSEKIFKEIAQFEEQIDRADEENRKMLESFLLMDPIPIINKKYLVKLRKDDYDSNVQVDYNQDISCIFSVDSSKLPFWKGPVRSSYFLKGVEIPARMKKPLLKKELVPDIVVIDDYILSNLLLSEAELEVVFRKNPAINAERFRLRMCFADRFTVEVYHAEENGVEENISANPELKHLINTHRLHEFGDNIIDQVNRLYSDSKQMVNLYLGGKDVFADNLIFPLMQSIAEILAPTLTEIKKHTPSMEELSLKEENGSGKRREIYLKKSQVADNLSAIGEKGDRILAILDIA